MFFLSNFTVIPLLTVEIPLLWGRPSLLALGHKNGSVVGDASASFIPAMDSLLLALNGGLLVTMAGWGCLPFLQRERWTDSQLTAVILCHSVRTAMGSVTAYIALLLPTLIVVCDRKYTILSNTPLIPSYSSITSVLFQHWFCEIILFVSLIPI